mmetsp:Transcript_10921/g.15379  ORF Transcript_10921/g.15379 Transcript_10921/m.15379 type:complete len:206 (+) Transcript_10921:680-1297(+)
MEFLTSSSTNVSASFSFCVFREVICMVPSSATSMLLSSKSSMMARICLPPGPMTFPILDSSILNAFMRGMVGGSSCLGSASTASILSSIWRRPILACWSARAMVGMVSPSHLMSSWKVVMPSRFPATLKSMVPSASSDPSMSERMTALSLSDVPFLSLSNMPMAIPATGDLIGTPASMSARQPPHTDAMEEDPLLSVMRDSTRME